MFQKLVIQKLGAYQKGKLYSRQRTGCQEGKLLSVLRTKIASLFSLPSCPLNFCSSDNDPLPCPPPREGACSRKFNQQSNACHCERQNGASQSHNLYNINEITTSNASHSPRNDIENSCKTQVVDGTATFPRNDLQSSCKTQCGGWSGYVPPTPGEGSRKTRFTLHSSLKKHAALTLAEGATHVVHFDDIRRDAFNLVKDNTHVVHFDDIRRDAFNLVKDNAHVATSDNLRRAAFTLAEVLITLGIIGVVAALTMPVLISNHKKKTTAIKVKKAYSIIYQALTRAQLDYGGMETWEYLSFTNDNIEERRNASKMFAATYLKPYVSSIRYEEVTTKKINNLNMTTPQIYLSDGTSIFINTGDCYDILVDINGDKNPNEGGRDVFAFYLCKNGSSEFPKFYTYGNRASNDRETLKSLCLSDTFHQSCTGLLEHDGWEFKDDYPIRL